MAAEVVWWLMRIEVLRHKTSNASRVIGKRTLDRAASLGKCIPLLTLPVVWFSVVA